MIGACSNNAPWKIVVSCRSIIADHYAQNSHNSLNIGRKSCLTGYESMLLPSRSR